MDVQLAQGDEEVERLLPVMLQLRDNYDIDGLRQQIRLQRQQGYQLAYVEADGAVLSVAGFVIGHKLAWGKHLYIDDLVSVASGRSLGAGKLLLDWCKRYAADQGCAQLHLDSGVQRFRAHAFYLREGMMISSHHFSIAGLAS
ncbi:MAG: GNAT family N-acetyltransferase [Halieaceae bacterium]|jgi:GNAT superfamily N-acetyltransferase|nr:GNAT family N-acetyltransferase [Halieaceae bacterium]